MDVGVWWRGERVQINNFVTLVHCITKGRNNTVACVCRRFELEVLAADFSAVEIA